MGADHGYRHGTVDDLTQTGHDPHVHGDLGVRRARRGRLLGVGTVAEEDVSALWILFAALSSYAIAYRFYARFIAYRVLEATTPGRHPPNGSRTAGTPTSPTGGAVLDEWALQLTEAGDYDLALEVALSALHSDPLRESAHRAVIRVHRAEGNVHEARRAFATCRSVLTQEIGVDPSPVTAELVP